MGNIVHKRVKGIDKPVGNRYNFLVDVLPHLGKDVPLNFGGRPRIDLLDKWIFLLPRAIVFQKDITHFHYCQDLGAVTDYRKDYCDDYPEKV